MLEIIRGMNWYVAKLVYQIVCGDGSHTPQFDEQLRLIRADEVGWAWEKAQVLGRMGQCSFKNSKQENVEWKFIDVVDVTEVASMEDGAQIYAETAEPSDAGEYLSVIRAKAERFFSNIDLRLIKSN